MSNNTEAENVRIGYKAAIDLINESGSQNWSRFNAIVLVNTLIGAVLAQALGEHNFIPHAWIIAVAAVLICLLVWLPLIARGAGYQKYYIDAARRLEQQLAPVNVLTEGRTFEQTQMRRYPSRISSRSAMYIAIALFVLLYIGTFVALWRDASKKTPPLLGGHFLLADKDGTARAKLDVDGRGNFSFELSDRDGKVIWRAP